MAGYTRRFIIVVRETVIANAIAAASRPDTDPTGGVNAFTRLLSTSGNLPAQARWCSWQLTPARALAIRARLQEEGATAAEVTPVPPGGTPATNRFAVFEVLVDGWTPELVLAATGLKRIVGGAD